MDKTLVERLEALREIRDQAKAAGYMVDTSVPLDLLDAILEAAAALRATTGEGEWPECNCPRDHRGQHIYVCTAPPPPLRDAEHNEFGPLTDAEIDGARVDLRPLRDAGAVAFRYRLPGDEWGDWISIRNLTHYNRDLNLAPGPHPDWEVEYAYRHPAPAQVDEADGRLNTAQMIIESLIAFIKGAYVMETWKFNHDGRPAEEIVADLIAAETADEILAALAAAAKEGSR